MKLVLLHGWGGDAGLWDAVVPLLPGFEILRPDRGYFGPERVCARPDGPVVAVGHSLGAMWLARQWRDVPLVAINGFDRFCGPDATPPRVLERMRKRFAQSPDTVLAEFRQRIGMGPAPAIASAQRLADDLALLADESLPPPRTAPLLVLQAQDDPLLPEALRRGTFGGAAAQVSPDGGHLLPLTKPAWVAAQIAEFAQ
jgi:pimeloyl-ACP methyl ester carboxylesterase